MNIPPLLRTGFFRLAKNVSKLSDHRVKVGAVIVNKKPLIACSNKKKTHPQWADPSKTIRASIHAECRAIINCRHENLEGATVYVYREDAKGNPKLARPCNFCWSVMKKAGIKKVYYTIEESPFYRIERIN